MTKSDIARISSSSRSIKVQLMKRKQMTVRAAGRLDQLAPEPEDVLLGEPIHEELHRVDDDAAGLLRLHRGEDRLADRREAVDVVDVVLLTAREEELG